MFDKFLEEIGLSDKETKVYVELLRYDDTSVAILASKTKIKRPTVYTVLSSLLKKGLVSEVSVGKKTHYQAEPPERLRTYVERQKILLEERERRLDEVIPLIKNVQRESGERPVVNFFEGKEGIISANESLYDDEPDGSEVYMVYSRDVNDKVFSGKELERFRNKRISRNIKSRVLYNFSGGERPSDLTGLRLKLDEKKYPISCEISVYKDSVRVNILQKRLSGIYIKSKDLADTLKSLINYCFDNKNDPSK